MKHTPTPWRKSEDRKGRVLISTALMGEPGAKDICQMEDGKELSAHHDANFIVTAVNAHEDLVKALKKSLSYLTEDDREFSFREVLQEVQQALAKAGVKP